MRPTSWRLTSVPTTTLTAIAKYALLILNSRVIARTPDSVGLCTEGRFRPGVEHGNAQTAGLCDRRMRRQTACDLAGPLESGGRSDRTCGKGIPRGDVAGIRHSQNPFPRRVDVPLIVGASFGLGAPLALANSHRALAHVRRAQRPFAGHLGPKHSPDGRILDRQERITSVGLSRRDRWL
jgi:hypothetical protein